MKITTTTGIVLDDEYGFCTNLLKYAKYKGLDNVRIFSTGNSYLIVEDNNPVFENQRAEDIAVHLDIMHLERSL